MPTIISVTPDVSATLLRAVHLFLARLIQLTHGHDVNWDESGMTVELVDVDGRQSAWGVFGVSEDLFTIGGNVIVDLYDYSTEPADGQQEEKIRLCIDDNGTVRQL